MPAGRTHRWLRLPSFALCCAVSLLMCLGYYGWIAIDPQYPTVLYFVRCRLGLQHAGVDWLFLWEEIRDWDSLGPRFMLFASLSGAATASSALLLIQFLRRATIRRTLLTVLVICAWLSLWTSYRQLYDQAVVRRAKRALPRFEAAARSLSTHWPTIHGTLPEAGEFYAYPDIHPDLLMLPGYRRYALREDFGHVIERSERGAIRFDLSGAVECRIEFHPGDSQPASFAHWSTGHEITLEQSVQLKEHWYLVRYGGS